MVGNTPRRRNTAMTDLSDFKRIVHEPLVRHHRKLLAENKALMSQVVELREALKEAEQRAQESAAFIGDKGLGDESIEWALTQRAKVDRLLGLDVLTLEWVCQACGWTTTVDAPGFAGDGRNHFPDGQTPCGPIFARRALQIQAWMGPVQPDAPDAALSAAGTEAEQT